jgi:uncharacterized Zn-binding protein involved in type VI secretion
MCGNDNVTEPADSAAYDDLAVACRLAEPICGTVGNPCEIGVIDAGVGECPYTIYVSGTSASPVTVVVSQPGFQTQEVPHVFDGLGGCVPAPTPGSQSAVVLVPNGIVTDAGTQAADAGDAARDAGLG